jgi:hypothetical protein
MSDGKAREASVKDERDGYRVTVEGGGVVAAGITYRTDAQMLARFADDVAEMLAESTLEASGWVLRQETDLLRILQISPCAKFVLVERFGRSSDEWLNVGVFTTAAERVSAVWQFGWNGARVSRNDSSGQLQDEHPEIYRWVVATLRTIGRADDEALRRCHRDSLSRAIDHLSGERRRLLNELAAIEGEIQRNEARLHELEPAESVGGYSASASERLLMLALYDAVKAHGIAPPFPLHSAITKVVDVACVRAAMRAKVVDTDADEEAADMRFRAAFRRAQVRLHDAGIIGIQRPYWWFTGKPVDGVPLARMPSSQTETAP